MQGSVRRGIWVGQRGRRTRVGVHQRGGRAVVTWGSDVDGGGVSLAAIGEDLIDAIAKNVRLGDDGRYRWHEFLELCPDAEFVDVGGASHMVAGDRNDVFADSVIEFLVRNVPPDGPPVHPPHELRPRRPDPDDPEAGLLDIP